MSHKKIVGILLGISILLFVTALLVMLPCDPQRNFVCEGRLTEALGQPLLFSSITLLFVFLILLFLPQNYFKAWLKYATWFIPVAILWIATSDVNCGGYLPVCFDKELATWWASGMYLVLSLVVIIVTYFTRRTSTYSRTV